jgi:phage-related protein
MNTITFGGFDSADYNVYVGGSGAFKRPARDVKIISVPGRNGDIVRDNGRFQNVEITYTALLPQTFPEDYDEYIAAISSLRGYQRLEDTEDADHYRKALYVKEAAPKATRTHKGGKWKIAFNCMPQRWLKSGETKTTLTASGSITNPTLYEAKPLIRVYGYGTLGVGSVTMTIAQSGLTYIDIDCESMNAMSGGTNANQYVSQTFPVLKPGANAIAMSGSITKIEITPRWWTI